MTDNRTTELLRKLLDERGVKYSDFTSATRNGKAIFKTRWKHERGYAELSEWESTGSNNLFIQNVDPEQAIAATLGVDAKDCENLLWEFIGALDVADATDASKKPIVTEYARRIAATLGSGTLTAEQVREAIFHGSVYASYDGAQYYANGINMQAIADELNARGERTCEPNWMLQGETQTQEFWRCECGNCGECFGVETRESFPLKMTIGEVDIPNYCPNCGCKVVDA